MQIINKFEKRNQNENVKRNFSKFPQKQKTKPLRKPKTKIDKENIHKIHFPQPKKLTKKTEKVNLETQQNIQKPKITKRKIFNQNLKDLPKNVLIEKLVMNFSEDPKSFIDQLIEKNIFIKELIINVYDHNYYEKSKEKKLD
ncbi:hypothetical protein M0811_07276 [Anaeramoeba ignava]|uniref:Uncharacterized protein n=1 Tax=Anaeramoeba ignava TaxID=1746090 RepID=A0A9Q0LKS8_ANAIG|nr:hypothetical protein M0811_07276 [Anaeramoeba ignava]